MNQLPKSAVTDKRTVYGGDDDDDDDEEEGEYHLGGWPTGGALDKYADVRRPHPTH